MLTKPSTCFGCELYNIGQGFMEVDGNGTNKVLLVGEALGEKEAEAGLPFQGPAGMVLNKALLRANLKREAFKIANVVWCRPPGNKLAGQDYAQAAIDHCSQYLDAVIDDMRPKCIVALGAIALRRLIPDCPVGILEARGYCQWSEKYKTYVIGTVHPSFIGRGNTAWAQVLIHDIQRGVEVAKEGLPPLELDYLCDPEPAKVKQWIEAFEEYYAANPDLYLSTDIETEGKDADEEALDLDGEEGKEYGAILRCGYSYKKGHALSIPWGGMYDQFHRRLLASRCQKLFWNAPFDVPRILAAGCEIGGTISDGMDAWHVLNSDLNKGLGFVTPFFYHAFPMWKHTSSEQPAWYNAADCDTAGVNMRGTVELLKKYGMWRVYVEYIQELDPVFAAMTKAGMPVDLYKRSQSAKLLSNAQANVRGEIEKIVPTEIKTRKPTSGYVREPDDKTGLSQFVFDGVTVDRCSICSAAGPKKDHFRSRERKVCVICGGKWTKAHVKPKRLEHVCDNAEFKIQQDNPCAGGNVVRAVEGVTRWARIEPFIPSTKGILKYQDFMGHPRIEVGKLDEKKATTDVKAIKKLIGKYPEDQFYKLVLQDREITKIAGTYVGKWNPQTEKVEGGMPVGRDGRVHGMFRHTPSTLRSSMVSPNLQNLPRGNDAEKQYQILVKQMFVAPPGKLFVARDFGGIEAVAVGWEANDADYYRLAKIDVHSYYTAFRLHDMGVLPAADLPDLSWSDSDLALWGKTVIKKPFGPQRDIGKRCIHAGNYLATANKLQQEYPLWFNKVKDAKRALDLYYEVFPKIKQWQERKCKEVDKTSITRNAFGHVHRFYHVLQWKKVKGVWTSGLGEDAKRLIAFGPQSNAAFIGKNALKRLFYGYEEMREWMRLFIHDDITCEVPEEHADRCDEILQLEMEKPIKEMPLDPRWKMGEYVTIGSEGKRGRSWAEMH